MICFCLCNILLFKFMAMIIIFTDILSFVFLRMTQMGWELGFFSYIDFFFFCDSKEVKIWAIFNTNFG